MRRLINYLGSDPRGEQLVVAFVLISVAVGLLTLSGCCATVPERAASARDALDAWAIIRDATVPHPSYGQAEREELERAEHALEAALVRLAEAE